MGSLAADDDEVLPDGTEPDTPPGDNALLDFARAEARGYGLVAEAVGGRVLVDDEAGIHAHDTGAPTPFGNAVFLTRPVPDADTADVTARVHGFFDEAAGGPYLVFSPWRTTDWRAHGFAPVGHPPLMLRAAGPIPAVPPGLHLEEVADEDGLVAFERCFVEAYPIEELAPFTRPVLLGAGLVAGLVDGASSEGSGWRFVVARLGDEVVGTAAAFVTPDVTAIEFVSTRPEARGHGVGAATTAWAATVAPDRPALLISSDDGQPVYRRLGFLPLLRYTLWLGVRGNGAT